MVDEPPTKLWKVCTQCESDFYVKESDKLFFEAKNLELPKRCWSCRQKNRKEAMEARGKQAEMERQAKPHGGLRTSRTAIDRENNPGTITRKREK